MDEAITLSQEASTHFQEKDFKNGTVKTVEVLKILIAGYSWMKTRQWMLTTLAGLFIGFGALIGSALLYQQNTIVQQQNELIREQNKNLIKQFKTTQEQINYDQDTKLLENIQNSDSYSDEFRAKALERLCSRIGTGKSDPNLLYSLIIDFDFSKKNFENITFSKVDFTPEKSEAGIKDVSFKDVTFHNC
jgi:hypothetical protein